MTKSDELEAIFDAIELLHQARVAVVDGGFFWSLLRRGIYWSRRFERAQFHLFERANKLAGVMGYNCFAGNSARKTKKEVRLRLFGAVYTFGLGSWAADLWSAGWRVSRVRWLPILRWERPTKDAALSK